MKKSYLFSSVAVIFVICSSLVLPPANPTIKGSKAPLPSAALPAEVNAIIKNSCMGCHSKGGNKIAMAKLNFFKWDRYKQTKQEKKAAAICKELSIGTMPPKSFKVSHPDAVPTTSQSDIICKWREALAQGN